MLKDEIYKNQSFNIQRTFQKFDKKKLNSNDLNQNLILYLSSLFKFQNKNIRNDKNDLFVPKSRLLYSLNLKIKGSSLQNSKEPIFNEYEKELLNNEVDMNDFSNDLSRFESKVKRKETLISIL